MTLIYEDFDNLDKSEEMRYAFDVKDDIKIKQGQSRITTYKLGEEIANGVRYFGQEKSTKGRRTAMCVCPKCGDLWRVQLIRIKHGSIKSCCNGKKNEYRC